MKKTLAILLASAALTTAVGLPALAAIGASDGAAHTAIATILGQRTNAPPVMQVADSDDDDHAYGDEHGYEDDDCDEDHGYADDDDGMASCASGANPAPAGTAAPPQNGLFANDTAPAVQVN